MKILLLGKGGQVGWELQRSLSPLGELIALDFDSDESGLCGDFTKPEKLAETVQRVSPDVIVNAAAYTAVDKAEAEPDLAMQINAIAPGFLAQAAEEIGALLVHYSTDYVFDGSGDLPWQELDVTAPLSVYGTTKLAGEKAVECCSRHLIFRTSWVYAARGANFAKTMLRLATEKDELKVIADQVGAPTGAELLADVTAHAICAHQKKESLSGVYHLVASGYTTWHAFACHVIERARASGKTIRVAPDRVLPIPTVEYPTPATRPHNSRLDTQKLQRAFGLTLPDWKVGVDRMLDEILV